jgi:drug/metabolite transporter (DMT)-like permease
MKSQSNVQKSIVALVALTAAFALLSVLARYLNQSFSISQQVYLRIFAALLMALVVFRRSVRWRVIRELPAREWVVIAFRGLTGYAIAVTLISKAANMTQLGHVAFIAALPFVPLLGILFLHERVRWWKVLFVSGSMLGVYLLAVKDVHHLLSWSRGDLVAIVATFAFAVSYVARRWHRPKLNNQEITMLTLFFGASMTLVLSLLLREGAPHAHQPLTIWLAVLAGGVLNVINLFLLNYSFEHLDAVRAGNLLNLESAWGLLFGLLFYHEWPSTRGLIGGIIIIASVVGMNLYSHREEAKLAPIQEESDT